MRQFTLVLALVLSPLLVLAQNTGAWTVTTPTDKATMTTLRGHTATSLPSGTILIVGGANSANLAQDLTFLYDGTATLVAGPPLPAGQARRDHCAVYHAASDSIHVLAGTDGAAITPDTLVYSVAGNSWSVAATAVFTPTPARYGMACEIVGDIVYAYGGRDISGAPLSEMLTYNVVSGVWATLSPGGALPSPRHDATLTAVKNSAGTATFLYMIGGGVTNVVPNLSNIEVWRFDPVGVQWLQLTPSTVPSGEPTRRFGHSAVMAGKTRVLIHGGYAGQGSGLAPNDYFNDLWEYDTVVNQWYAPVVTGATFSARQETTLTAKSGTTDTFVAVGGWNKFAAAEGDFNTLVYTPVVCAPGSFSPDGITNCAPCAAGSFAATDNTYTCTACPIGTFVGGTGNTVCTFCPGGTYGSGTGGDIDAASACTSCGVGTFSPTPTVTPNAGIGSCQACPVGTASNSPGQSSCPPCGAGTYTDTTGKTTCDACTPGNRCPTGTLDPCPAGEEQPLGSKTTCDPCPVATYSTGGAANCTPCPAGTFALVGGASLAVCTPCPTGSYQPSTKSTSCIGCGAGKFSTVPVATSSSVCQNCPAGTASSLTVADSLSLCNTCAPGSYSLGGQGTCTLCAPGTYNPSSGSISAAACLVCPPGSSSASSGLTSAAQCSQCPPGTYSSLGTCVGCPAGTFSTVSGATSSSVCTACPHNSISPVGASQCFECDPGTVAVSSSSYCETCATVPATGFAYADFLANRHLDTATGDDFASWTETGLVTADGGGYTEGGSTNAKWAASLTATAVSPTASLLQTVTVGATDPTKHTVAFSAYVKHSGITGSESSNFALSVKATYTDASTRTVTVPLPVASTGTGWAFVRGFVPAERGITTAELKATISSPHLGTFLIDSFSLAKTSVIACACDPGLHHEQNNMARCTYCPLGNACVLSTKFKCDAGFHAFGGRQVCSPCPPGWWCSNGRAEACSPGTYPDPVGKASCITCPDGHACPGGVIEKCSNGFFGTGLVRCNECLEGSYNPLSTPTNKCTTCPDGSTSQVMSETCKLCPRGEFSVGGAACASCPKGTFAAAKGASSCQPCPVNTYAPSEGFITCLKCPVGKTTAGGTGKFSLSDCV